jgi:lipoprotein-releasing system ATP-binding protein
MAKTLQADGITKDYSTRRGPLPVLRGVSLSLAEGGAAVIMGPSGSGKSTLLNILGTLETPSAGSVLIDGRDPFKLPEPELAEFRNRRIGFIFQEHHLLPHCSVLENVLLPTLASACTVNDNDKMNRARRLLDRVGLSDRLDHRPAELSGGERQRVAVARSLINRPLLVLADEPTGNLDRATADSVAALILELHREENTILLAVTHSRGLAEAFGRRYELSDGNLTAL